MKEYAQLCSCMKILRFVLDPDCTGIAPYRARISLSGNNPVCIDLSDIKENNVLAYECGDLFGKRSDKMHHFQGHASRPLCIVCRPRGALSITCLNSIHQQQGHTTLSLLHKDHGQLYSILVSVFLISGFIRGP